jgi:inosine-uridine nucleoside N-ribohydrolase
MRKPILIDTDCGIDDALALILALRSPELDVRAIVTVAGNVEVKRCTRNVLTVLSVVGGVERPLVSQGSSKPLRRTLVTAKEVHGKDGLGNSARMRSDRSVSEVRRNGTSVILDFCRQWKALGTIIAIGPLTNIARAWKRDPSSVRKIGRIVSMGGAFRIPGNTGPVAEFNYFVDPEAAHMVIASGLPVDIVPLDITHQVALLRREVESRSDAASGRISSFVSRITRFYMDYHESSEGFHGGYLHDPVAVAAVADPSVFDFNEASVAVETRGRLTRGMSVRLASHGARQPDGTRSDAGVVRIASRIDREGFLGWFHERMWG